MSRKKRSSVIIGWIEGTNAGFSGLRVPEGKLVGKPIKLRPFQKKFICDLYDNPHGTRRAILSMGRKNGKTSLLACLLLVHLMGPEAQANSQLFSSAQSRDQAAILFALACKMIRQSDQLRDHVHIRETAKELYCGALGTRYRALSADATTAYGLSPVFVLHDELAQVRGPRSEMYEALETAVAAHNNPLSVVISTQAPQDSDLLSVLIDDAIAGNDPRVICHLYAAADDDDPFDVETIKKANPAFAYFQNSAEILAMAEDARRMPAREPEYANLILNRRVEASSPFVSKAVWDSNGGHSRPGVAWYGGLDLSETSDLTSLELISFAEGVWHVDSTFWLPAEGLADRARKDRVPYDTWVQQGFLQVTPGRSIEYEYVAQHLAELFATRDIRKIAFDRYNMRHLRPWLVKAGLTESFIDDRFIEFGQGYFSMSPALRNFESLLLNARLRHGMHPILTMCAANSVVKTDEAGNRKLDKKRSRGRIDGMVALAMAAEVANANASQGTDTAFSSEQLKYWTDEPKDGNRYILVCAANDKKPNPAITSMLVVDLGEDKTYRLIEIVRAELNLTERTDLLFDFHRAHDPIKVVYEKRGYEGDIGHIEDRQSRENYRFRVDPVDSKLSENERIMRLVPLAEQGRIVLPEKHERDGADMTEVFRAQQFAPYPYGAHTDLLDCLSRILDCRAEFPQKITYVAPEVFESEWS